MGDFWVHELFLSQEGCRVGAHGYPQAYDAALAQPSCSAASMPLPDPFMKGHEPRSPLCLSGASAVAKSWVLISVGTEESDHEVISSSFALAHTQMLRGARCRSKEEEYFREGR